MRIGLNELVLRRAIRAPIRLPMNLTSVFWRWMHNARSRQALRDLPQYLFDDVGMTRAQAEAESLKRFWMK